MRGCSGNRRLASREQRRAPGASAWCLTIAVLAFASATATAGELETLLERVSSAGKGIRTLQVSFTQYKRLPLFRSEVVSKGRLAYARPDRLRWETFPPDAAVLVLRGERAEFRIPGEPPRAMDLKPGSALGSLVDQMLIWFGLRPAEALHRHYRVSLRRDTSEAGQTSKLELTPKHPALRKRVATIEIWLGRDLAPRRLRVVGSEGEATRIEFGPIQRNLSLPPELFR